MPEDEVPATIENAATSDVAKEVTEGTGRRKKSVWPIDFDALTLTADGVTYSLEDVPFTAKMKLALVGLRSSLRLGHSFDELKNGEFSRGKVAKPKELTEWQRAVVGAMVEATKKHDAPLSESAATERARLLSREEMAKLRTDPIVVKHFNRITRPAATALTSLLAPKAEDNNTDQVDAA